MSALNKQIGGDHYKSCAIQPIEFIKSNKLGFLEGCIIKRLTRYNKPSGKGLQDLQKALHELELILQFDYPDGTRPVVVNTAYSQLEPISIRAYLEANALVAFPAAVIAMVANHQCQFARGRDDIEEAHLCIRMLIETQYPDAVNDN